MMYSVRIFCTTVLLGVTVLAEAPASNGYPGNDLGFSSPSLKGIRYAGPIVYTNERPPVIHFPPPPPASTAKDFQGITTRGKSVKYVPMPTHDLPILIYTSDVSPPLHVVSPPGQGGQFKGGKERMQADYSNSMPSYSTQPSKSQSSVKASTKSESYRTVEPYPEKSASPSKPGRSRGVQSFYERFPFTQSIKNFLEQSPSFKSLTSPSAPPRAQKSKRKQSFDSESLVGEYSTKNEVVAKPRPTPKQASPLPHIIYTGHAPIHIFNQSPVYVPKSQTQSQHASPKATQDFEESESVSRPRYAPKGSGKENNRFRGFKESLNNGFSKYSKPGFYSGKEQPMYKSNSYNNQGSRHTKPNSEYNYNSNQRKPYKPKPISSTKSPYPIWPSSQQSSHSSSPTTYSKNYVRSSAMAPKQRKPTKSSQKNQYFGKSAPAKQYSPAPSALKKPPIIIYQGLYPPHHVYENPPAAVDYRIGQPSQVASIQQDNSQPIASRMSSGNNEGVSLEPRLDTEYGLETQAAPMYYLPALEMSAPAMYVSDLTSQGTAPPQQFFTVLPTQNAAISSPQTHTIQIQNADGTHSTAQVTTITTTADQAVQSPVNEARIDSIPTTFLASGLNNQNNPLVPMSISSIIVQSAGAQPH